MFTFYVNFFEFIIYEIEMVEFFFIFIKYYDFFFGASLYLKLMGILIFYYSMRFIFIYFGIILISLKKIVFLIL